MSLLEPYLVWIKLGLAAVLLAALGLFAWKVHGWHADSLRVAAVEADRDAIKAQASKTITDLQTAYKSAQMASEGFQSELSKLRTAAAAAGPAPVIRVCRPAAVRPAPAATAAKPGPDAAPAPAGEPSESVGLDTGPLYGIADSADALAAQVRALQEYIRGLPQ